MNRKLKDEDMDILFRGILKLQTVEDCYDFFEDLCTIAELRAMVQRFQVARMLDEGRIYSDIGECVSRIIFFGRNCTIDLP